MARNSNNLWTRFVRRRSLAFELARRDIFDRYLNQQLGGAWAIITPLLTMGLYLVLFTVVYPSRMSDNAHEGDMATVIYLLCGLVCWLYTSEVINRSLTAIEASASLVKQVVFPPTVIPLKIGLVAQFPFFIMLTVLIIVTGVVRWQSFLEQPVTLGWTAGLLAGAVFLHILFLRGIAFAISAIAAYLKDLKEVLGFLLGAGLFLAPILYTPETLERLPPVLYWIVQVNPVSHFVWMYQDAVYYGQVQHPISWGVAGGLALVSVIVGHRTFHKLSGNFGDVV
jgi:lipopolysaccharide transport system permease protein